MSLLLTCAVAVVAPWVTIEAAGSYGADIDGVHYSANNYPSGWSASIENTNETLVTLNKGVTIRRSVLGTVLAKSAGAVYYTYKFRTNEALTDYTRTIYTYTMNANTDAYGNNLFTTSSCKATAGGRFSNSGIKITSVLEKDDPVTTVRKGRTVYSGLAWADLGTYKQLLIDYGSMTRAYASASNTVLGANSTAAVASASSSTRMIPISMTIGGGGVSLTASTFLKQVDVDVYFGPDQQDSFTSDIVTAGAIDVPLINMPSGSFDFYIRARNSVSKKVTVSYTAGVWSSGGSVTLYYGDINGDNEISKDEVDYVSSQIGKNSSSADWLDPSGNLYSWTPSMADIDGDGQVTSADYSLVSGNTGKTGDVPAE